MKRKELLKVIIGVSLVAVLAIGIPMMSGCRPAPPEVAPPEVAPPEVAPPEVAPPEEKVITAKIGFLAPLTGPAAGWGLPGLYGDEIWVERFNEQGGLVLSDGTRVLVELVEYDNEYIGEKALTGAKKLVLEDKVVMVQMLGGHTAAAAVPWMTKQMMLSTTLLPSDLTPATLYHLAPTEVCPFHSVTGADWITRNYPELHTVAFAAQDDELGRPCGAATSAAFEAGGYEIVYFEFFDIETTDFAPVMSDLIASGADVINITGAYPDFVNLLCVQAYEQGFDGLLYTGTLDFYDAIIEKTSVEFLEGTVWFFPDFDDPMMNPSPSPLTLVQPIDFWDEYNERWPGTWSAVSWEYQAQLDQWRYAVLEADSIEPMDVFKVMKASPTLSHPFGEGRWWGKSFWGIDNALMSPWPVVTMQDGKGRIVEFVDQLDWWEKNKEYMVKWNMELDEMWWQRMGVDMESGIKLWGLEEEYQFLLEE